MRLELSARKNECVRDEKEFAIKRSKSFTQIFEVVNATYLIDYSQIPRFAQTINRPKLAESNPRNRLPYSLCILK